MGKTGKELDRYLDGQRLPEREDIFITNLFRQYGGKDYKWTEEDVKNDEGELIYELARVQPKVIITMGRWSTRWFLGQVDLEDTHGLPWRIGLCQCGKPIQLTAFLDSQSHKKTDVGYRQANRRGMGTAVSGKMGSQSRLMSSRTSTSSDQEHTKPSTIFVETSDASTLHIWNQRAQEITYEHTIPIKLAASVDIRSPEAMYTLLRKNNISECAGPACVKVLSVGRNCTCAAGSAWREVIVVVMYHIAAGFHSPETSGLISYDFAQIAAFFDGKIQPRVLFDDPYPEPNYEEITSAFQLEAALCRLKKGQSLAIDTEGSPAKPWSIQISVRSGEAYVIRAQDKIGLQHLNNWLQREKPHIVFHNSLHDMGMLRVLGISLEGLDFSDTMVAAYLLAVEPKGLKPLLIRHCNMAQKSYDDLLGSTQNELAINYFTCLWDIEQATYEERCESAFHAEIANGRRLKVHPKLPKSNLHKAVERGLRSAEPYKLWKRWEDDRPDTCIEAIRLLDTMPQASLDHIEVADAIHYGGRDADGTHRLLPELHGRLVSMGLEDVYALELSTYPLIDRMQSVGFKPDLERYRRFSDELQVEIDRLQAVIESDLPNGTGIEGFNANSADQLSDFLFNRLNLRGFKKTDSGRWKADKKVLEALEHEHPELPVLSNIHQYKETYKLKNTFVDRIPRLVNAWPFDGRIHPAFRTTSIPTGRLAASMPFGLPKFNPLAMPKHGKHAKGFRRGIVAGSGHRLCEWDLSQIELRGLAHLSQDPVMLAVFRGERRNPDGSRIDLHAALAQRIFGVAPRDQDDSKHRLPAKAINFGLPMGMTYKGLTVELRKNGLMIGEDDAQRWIDETMKLYKGIRPFQQACIAEAKKHGYVRCLDGRIRYIGGIRSWDEAIRAEAERLAFSTKIQNSAQLVMKRAEASVWKDVIVYYERQGRWVQPLLQVHDALDLECEDDPKLAQELNERMVTIMTATPPGFSVPIETSGDWGYHLCKRPKKGPFEDGDMIPFDDFV